MKTVDGQTANTHRWMHEGSVCVCVNGGRVCEGNKLGFCADGGWMNQENKRVITEKN